MEEKRFSSLAVALALFLSSFAASFIGSNYFYCYFSFVASVSVGTRLWSMFTSMKSQVISIIIDKIKLFVSGLLP